MFLQDLGFSSLHPRRKPIPGNTVYVPMLSSRTGLMHCSQGLASRISTFLDLFYSLLCFYIADLFSIKIFNHFWVWCHLSYLPSSCFDLYSLYFALRMYHIEILINLGTGPGSSPFQFCGQGMRLPHPFDGSVTVTIQTLEH